MKRLSFRQSLAMLGLNIGLQVVLGVVLIPTASLFQGRQESAFAVMAVADAASIVGTVWLATRIYRVSWRSLLAFGPMPWRLVPAVVLMGLGSFVLASEVDN